MGEHLRRDRPTPPPFGDRAHDARGWGAGDGPHRQRPGGAVAGAGQGRPRPRGGPGGHLRLVLGRRPAPGVRRHGPSGPPAGGQDVRLPAGPRPTPATRPTWVICCAWVGCPRRGWPRQRCASWCATGPSWWRCAAASRPRSTRCWPSRGAGADERPVRVAGTRLLEELRLPRAYGLRVASLGELLGALDQQIAMLGREIGSALAGDVGDLAIQAIPGVGPVLAAILVAEIGEVGRFAGAPQLCSWAGLTPRHRESDTTVRRGPSPTRAPGWCAGPRSRPPSGCPGRPSRPPTSIASPTDAAPASAASPWLAGC